MAPSRCSMDGSGSFVNEASAELAESANVARLDQRPLLRKARARRDSIGAGCRSRAAICVQRSFEPLPSSCSRIVINPERADEPRFADHDDQWFCCLSSSWNSITYAAKFVVSLMSIDATTGSAPSFSQLTRKDREFDGHRFRPVRWLSERVGFFDSNSTIKPSWRLTVRPCSPASAQLFDPRRSRS